MYVCICQAVTEGEVREAVRNGAHSVRALRERLGLAAECGACVSYASGIIQECCPRPGRSDNEVRAA